MFNFIKGKEMSMRLRGLILVALSLVLFTQLSCKSGSGDTSAGEEALYGTQFVDNGGAGASIEIELTGSLTVGGESGFFVKLRDSNGQPLPFIRVTCDSEKGIAILEPSSNGVAMESTGSDGNMSGRLGGVTAGSFLIECRAPQGFNLVARQTVQITGSGAAEFHGAAGGNLGGGLVVEVENVQFDQNDVVISAIGFETVTGTSTKIDTFQVGDCDGDVLTVDPEAFGQDDYQLTIQNDSEGEVFVRSVQITIAEISKTVTYPALPVTVTIPANGSGSFSSVFTETNGSLKRYLTSQSIANGSWVVSFVVTYESEAGDEYTTSASTVVSFDGFNNC